MGLCSRAKVTAPSAVRGTSDAPLIPAKAPIPTHASKTATHAFFLSFTVISSLAPRARGASSPKYAAPPTWAIKDRRSRPLPHRDSAAPRKQGVENALRGALMSRLLVPEERVDNLPDLALSLGNGTF